MHAIQTSGNSVRNITSDEFAGVAADELVDPRAFCEILRQWSSFHPEFTWLPRKFKIAINGAREDRAAVAFHDIGLHLTRAPDGALGFRVLVGGGMGRTPIIGSVIREFLPWQQYLTYIESILRVYNRHGRRDNIHKARIKILVRALGIEEFARQVEEDFAPFADGPSTVTDEELHRVASYFAPAPYRALEEQALDTSDRAFARWVERSVKRHRVPGYRSVVLSLKPTGIAPGDATAEQMDFVADWAERYGFGEIRVSHEQNLILPDVRLDQLRTLWQEARAAGLATSNIGLLTDIIACPAETFVRLQTRSRYRSPKAFSVASTILTICTTWARSTSISRAASTRAGIITSVTSASWASTRMATSGTRYRSAAPMALRPAANASRSAASSGRHSRPIRCPTLSSA